MRVFEAQDADSAALRAELERVRGLVREAFTEGYEHAEYHNEKNIQHSGRMEDAWKYSDSAAALVITQTPTEEGGGDAQ